MMMKNSRSICLVIFILAATCTTAQDKTYLISMQGLGELKLGMSQAALEKLLNKKIHLPNQLDTINDLYQDTAKLTYKNIPVQLEFNRSYTAPNKFYMRLVGIRASSPLCKTASGIGVGSDKQKIITAYNNYSLYIQPGYANYYETEEGEGKSTIIVKDDAASVMDGSDAYTLLFFLLNKKLVSFELKAALRDER